MLVSKCNNHNINNSDDIASSSNNITEENENIKKNQNSDRNVNFTTVLKNAIKTVIYKDKTIR